MIDPDPDDNSDIPFTQKPVDIQEDGILAHINRAVFHPMGFALAYDEGEKRFYILGDGKEPWTFEDDERSHERFRSFWRTIQELKSQ